MALRAEQIAPGDRQPPNVPAGRVAGWPPPWRGPDPSAPGLAVSWPPTVDQLDYAQKAITVFLLVLALPALLAALAKRPDRVMAGAARKHLG